MGNVVYEVTPSEKIKKDFLEEAKQKILSDIGTLNDKEKKMLKYLESQGKGIKGVELIKNCFLSKEGGSARSQISQWSKSLVGIEVARKDAGGLIFPLLKERIKFLLETKDAKPKEEEIMTLKKGHFFLSCYDGVFNVYVQPLWLSDEDAVKISKGCLTSFLSD